MSGTTTTTSVPPEHNNHKKTPAAPTAPSVSSSNNRSFRTRCGDCDACQREDCGSCVECIRKKKFGGDGSSKQACIFRRCTNLQDRRSKYQQQQVQQALAVGSTKVVVSTNSSSPRDSSSNNNNNTSNHSRKYRKMDFEFRPPASLLEERSLKRARILREEQEESAPPPPMPIHMCGLPIPEEKIGACGQCGMGEGEDGVILLCDGEGCGKEFHMQCCLPPIHIVPEGSFYCFDCSPKGSTAQLEEYFQEHEDSKYDFEMESTTTTTASFVDTLHQEDLEEEHRLQQREPEEEPPTSLPKDQNIPVSELDWIHRNDPESLIGQPIRLYCTHGNQYHNGRILDVQNGENDNNAGDTQCKVRFPAGKDYRKTPLTTWLHLEEHCLAVATRILWGHFGTYAVAAGKAKSPKSKNQSDGSKWIRARLWSRTARELIPVMHLLSKQQIRFRNNITSSTKHHRRDEQDAPPDWGLVETFGTDIYELLPLASKTRKKPPPPPTNTNSNTPSSKELEDRETQVQSALALAELKEQERIREWRKLPLLNPVHKAALRCQDEYALGTLEFRPPTKQYIRPSPLIPQGLDRAYLLARVSQRLGIPPTKDFGATLACELVDSVPDAVQALTRQDQKRWMTVYDKEQESD